MKRRPRPIFQDSFIRTHLFGARGLWAEGTKKAPRGPQDGPRKPRWPQSRPRGPLRAPKKPPIMPQEDTQDAPRGPKERPQDPQHFLNDDGLTVPPEIAEIIAGTRCPVTFPNIGYAFAVRGALQKTRGGGDSPKASSMRRPLRYVHRVYWRDDLEKSFMALQNPKRGLGPRCHRAPRRADPSPRRVSGPTWLQGGP